MDRMEHLIQNSPDVVQLQRTRVEEEGGIFRAYAAETSKTGQD